MDLSRYITPTLSRWRSLLNLTEDEEIIFNMLSKKKSVQEISAKLCVSSKTAERRITNIKKKIKQLEELDKKDGRPLKKNYSKNLKTEYYTPHVCGNCLASIGYDWQYCPYCGNATHLTFKDIDEAKVCKDMLELEEKR